MATVYEAPGVYVEEIPPVARPIAGVGTSTAAFIGVADRLATAHREETAGNGYPTSSSWVA